MDYTIRNASIADSVKIAKMLRTSLKSGVEGRFTIDNHLLLNHVQETIRSASGFATVLMGDDELVGCFMAEVSPHSYCRGNIVQELGAYIKEEHRGSDNFEKLFRQFLFWSGNLPDVLLTTFTIGQLGATTPYLRSVMSKYGFTKGDEGYYRT